MGDATPLTSEKEEILLLLLPFPEPVALLDNLRKVHPHITFIYRQLAFPNSKAEIEKLAAPIPDELFKNVTILVTFTGLPARPELIPKIKFIHFVTAGTDHISKHPIYTDTNITLTTSSGIHGPTIAEWVVLQILSNSRKQKLLLQWQREKKWGSHGELGVLKDSVGMRLGVLGYGSIGRQVARVGKSLGMDVIAYTASPRKTPESKRDNGYFVPGTGDEEGSIPSAWYSGLDKPSLQNFLSQDIDVLVVSVPLTKETRHFLSDAEFAILGKKKNAFVANISRGAIIDQVALAKYCKLPIKDGGLRGAALDVTEPEPLPIDDEIWEIDNIAITPHISALSIAYQSRSFEILERNLENLENGKDLINVVNRKRGY